MIAGGGRVSVAVLIRHRLRTENESINEMTRMVSLRGRARESYLEWVSRFPLVSIRSENQLERAQRIIDELLRGPAGCGDRGAEVYLEALSDLVAVYEDRFHTIEPATDAQMLQHLMEARAVSQAELSRGARIAKSTVSEMLSGKRPFSRQIIRKLSTFFDVNVSVLSVNL